MSDTFRSILEKLDNAAFDNGRNGSDEDNYTVYDALADIEKLIEEKIIGGDEITYANYEDGFFGGKKVTRDKLRESQRTTLKALLGKKE